MNMSAIRANLRGPGKRANLRGPGKRNTYVYAHNITYIYIYVYIYTSKDNISGLIDVYDR